MRLANSIAREFVPIITIFRKLRDRAMRIEAAASERSDNAGHYHHGCADGPKQQDKTRGDHNHRK